MMRLSKGPAASNTYYEENGKIIYQLTLDWSFDGVYFTYDNQPIIFSIGPRTDINELHMINTPDKINALKNLAKYTKTNLIGYSGNSDNALSELNKIINNL